MENLEECSIVMEQKMARFDDAVDSLKSVTSNVEKNEEVKAKHEENNIQEEMFRRRMQEGLKIQKIEVTDEV